MSSFHACFPRTGRLLKEVASVVLTEDALWEFSLEDVDFVRKMDGLYGRSSREVCLGFLLALWLLEGGAWVTRGRSFLNLSPAQKKDYWESWAGSSSFLTYALLRILLVFIYTAYYSHPAVSEKLGFKEKVRSTQLNIQKIKTYNVQVSGKNHLETEICVIGSGAGGAVVAKELAEKGHGVLLLEEGGHYDAHDFRKLTTVERNSLLYRDAGLFTTLGWPPILLPTGKAVGGTTLINSGTCFRTPLPVLERWSREFGLDVDATELEPYFQKVEHILHIHPEPLSLLGGNNHVIHRAAQSLGLHGHPLSRNTRDCQGSGECIFGCPQGAKQSMERSYIPRAIEAGAQLLTHCRVQRLQGDYGRVHTVEAILTDPETGEKRPLTIHPRKVVVAGGTLESPLLLKRSGIGLQSGQLGRNLTIHPTAKMMGVFDEVIDGFKGVPQGYGITDFEPEGMMFETVFFPPWLLATSMFHSGEAHRAIMKQYRNISIFGFLVHDESRGRVVAGAGGKPLVFYSLGSREKALFVQGLKILARLFFSQGARVVYPTLRSLPEAYDLATVERLDARHVRRRDLESAAFHPLGTCRMGFDRRSSVVDGNLQVHGMENLWVADGSVFPTSLGVNPQLTIMAFANRCAEFIHNS